MISRTITQVIVGSTLLAGGFAAHAQTQGLYLGGSLGVPNYSSSVNGIGGDGSGTAYKLYGGYQFTPNYAIEGGAFGLGETTDATGSAKTHGLYVDGVGMLEFAPKWSLIGSLGLAHGQFSSTAGDDTSVGLKLGAGVQYAIAPKAAVRLQYDQYRFVNAYGTKPDIGAVTLGLKMAF